jgi:hypothetical protein
MKTRYFLLAAVAVVMSLASFGQVTKTGSYSIIVKGTSNLHDWSMKTNGAGIAANFSLTPGVAHVANIPSLAFNIPVNTLKSGESLMDKRAYETLNASKNPNISFKVVGATASGENGNKSTLNVTGILTIAGNARQLTLSGNTVTGADGTVTITGAKKIKMSEFGVKPPSFMFGALKVGDELTIEYSATFK